MKKIFEITNKVSMGETEYSAPTEWRMIGARGKAQNIVNLCNKNGILVNKYLEVGAGDGAILRSLDSMNFGTAAHALEVSQSGLDLICSFNLQSLKQASLFNGYSIPYRDNEFDLVILSHVLEHVEYERTILREVQRVSKFQIIEVPIDYTENCDESWTFLNSYGHINVYTPTLLRFLLRSEKYRLIDDLPNRYSFEVVEYLHFEYHKNPRTKEAVVMLKEEYDRNEQLFFSLPKSEQEKRSNSYTALCRRISDEELFDEYVSLANQFYNENRHGDVKLLLGGLGQYGIENCKPLPMHLELIMRN